MLHKKYLAFLCLLLSYFINACNNETDFKINVNRISQRVAVFTCLDVNVSAVACRKGIIIIDTNRSPGIMKKIKEEIEIIFGRNDFIYVINTHGHWDHSSGNQVFNGLEIIGHKNCPDYIKNNDINSPMSVWSMENRITKMRKDLTIPEKTDNEVKEIKDNIEAWNIVLQDIKNEYIPAPSTITFNDTMTLYMGDLTIKMIYCGNAHTNNDIFIYIPEEKLVFTGDMFVTESRFGFSINELIDVPRIISSMEKIIDDLNEIEFVVPGHGALFPGNTFNNLKNILEEKYKLIAGGESIVKLLKKWIEELELNSVIEKYSKLISVMREDQYYLLEDEFNTLGRRYMAMGMLNKAIVVFTLEAYSFPSSALAYDNLGEAYLRKGEFKKAKMNYEKSLDIFPDNKNAREILKFIHLSNNQMY
jgi:glyoxylase-like metal-dependent hydrolase (beta-lactamase superfamily II)